MATLADKAILSGADNRPPMLEKDMYDSWKIRIELYMMNRQHGRMILESLSVCWTIVPPMSIIWPSIEENEVTRPKKYSELSATKAIQADYDIWATNIILQGLPLEERKFNQPDSDLIVPVFQTGDDPIDSINHMMSFLTAVVTSRYPTTNNQLRNSSNPRQQATINDGRVTLQPIQGRQTSFYAGECYLLNCRCVVLYSNSSCTTSCLILSVIEQLKTQVVDCTKINLDNRSVNDTLTAELERYKEQVKLEPKLYDGNVIKNTSAIVIPNSEETLMLAEESHSKMLLKQQDPMMLEKKVNTTPVDYANFMNSPEPTLSSRPTNVEVPKELLKVSMVNTSLKKLKHHLAGFNVVVKERTTTTAITEGS
ncbi:hypothetical protein Tco_0567121 [Tanacetum coccineum]